MNRAFRIIWSHARQAFVVTHELASARGKRGGARLLLAAAGAGLLAGGTPTALLAADICAGNTTLFGTTTTDTCDIDAGTSFTVSSTSELSNPAGAAVSAGYGFGTIRNGGLLSGTGNGITLVAGELGSTFSGNLIENLSGATISGAENGIFIGPGYSVSSLTNAGTIQSGFVDNAGIALDGATLGTLHNQAGGIIENTGGGGAIHLIDSSISSDFVNDGTIRNEGSNKTIFGNSSSVGGDFINNGLISNAGYGTAIGLHNGVTIGGDLINGEDGVIEGGEGALQLVDSTITGDLINLGNIQGASSGIDLSYSSATNITNQGSIASEYGDGLALGFSTVTGDVVNAGSIETGDKGLVINATSIGGDLRNEGSIDTNYWGIVLDATTLTGNVVNAAGASIDSAAHGSIGFRASSATSIVNAGDLTSSNGIGLYIGDSTLSGSLIDGNLTSLVNSGEISVAYDGILVEYSELTGDLLNLTDGLISASDTAGTAIRLSNSQLHGSLINQGSLQVSNGADGIALYSSTLDQDLINQGSISSIDDGILLADATISGDLINDTDGLIETGDDAIDIADSTIAGDLINHGTIRAVGAPDETSRGMELEGLTLTGALINSGLIESTQATGIDISSGSSIGAFNNSGTLSGADFALSVDSGSTLSTLNLIGTQARLIGDVLAQNTDVVVNSNAVFGNDNAFDVKSFTIESGATLNMGTGTALTEMQNGFTVNNGFTNAGTLALASNVTGTIQGNYTQSSNGTLKIGVANNTTFGKLVVDGSATLASNAKIVVDVTTPSYTFTTKRLQNVLSATSLTSDGTFLVDDNSTLFKFGAVKDGNTVDLTLTKEGSGLVEEIVTDLGNSPAVGAAQVLDQVIADDPTGELAGHFVGLTNEQAVSDAVTSTLPTAAANSASATSGTLASINRVVQARQDSNSGLSSGDATADDNLWLKTFGSWAEQDQRSGISGYDADTQGLAIGADAAVSDNTRLGLAFAYAHTNLDNDSRIAPQSAEIDTFQLIGYGSYALAPDTELNFQLDAGQNRSEGKRYMPFADATAKADYDGYNVHAGAGIGHTLNLSEQLSFVPSARIDYTWIGTDSYQEKGAGALDLDVDSNDAEELLFSLDGKLNYNLSDATVLSANLGAGYDLINEQSSITSAYAGASGASFSTPGMEMEPWLARAGLGLTHTLAGGTEVGLRYDAEARSDFTNQGASLKARWAF